MSPRILRFLAFALLATFVATGTSLADWRASGTFKYQDREFDKTGFTGSQPTLPTRMARVEVRDANKNGGAALLATTTTDPMSRSTIARTPDRTGTIRRFMSWDDSSRM